MVRKALDHRFVPYGCLSCSTDVSKKAAVIMDSPCDCRQSTCRPLVHGTSLASALRCRSDLRYTSTVNKALTEPTGNFHVEAARLTLERAFLHDSAIIRPHVAHIYAPRLVPSCDARILCVSAAFEGISSRERGPVELGCLGCRGRFAMPPRVGLRRAEVALKKSTTALSQ